LMKRELDIFLDMKEFLLKNYWKFPFFIFLILLGNYWRKIDEKLFKKKIEKRSPLYDFLIHSQNPQKTQEKIKSNKQTKISSNKSKFQFKSPMSK
jgi:vancomycin resistance protein YoaR